jgi:cell wall-associated NlpC family hydrolase
LPVNGIALAAVGTGSIFLWSGVKGWNASRIFAEVISGQVPKGSNVNLLTTGDSSSSSVSSGSPIATSNALANDAQKYQGHAYSYGGAPGKDGKSPWDCSSFINWVVGHDGRRSIPGYPNGSYDGSSHGPPTGSWGIWPGLQHIQKAQLQAGDIVVWVGHMGMALGPDTMISALSSRSGTKITPIAGYGNGPILCYGRLK